MTEGAGVSFFLALPVLSSSGVSYSSDAELATLALLREREVIHRALLRRNGVFFVKNGAAQVGRAFADRGTK